ncbi:MAG: UDP-glucose--hexose-1-phosphate uridylyltransferase [Clostridia bacterium]|nr:UDP-glucose--hexose-1-phosphate uridylyltransferase [Clostridia bacterium]
MSPKKSIALAAACNIEELLDYAKNKLSLESDDVCYVRNALLALLKLPAPSEEKVESYTFQQSLDALVEYAINKGITTQKESLLFETQIMGLLMPMPSRVIETFDSIASYDGVKAATKWFNELNIASNYIRKYDIDKNIKWEYDGSRGKIGITINLAKPEKDPKDVARAKLAATGYPKCMLCAENVGFFGNAGHPARQTIRIIPLSLNNEQWFLQYSPYVYFDQHLIVVNQEHKPMNLTPDSFVRMLDFVELFPHYFIGSNAPLPIVGGSILAHDHYQGGSKVLPMFASRGRSFFNMHGFPEVNVSIPNWYNSVVRLSSRDRNQILGAVEKLRGLWDVYSDESVNIIAYTLDEDGKRTQHNTVTPICRMNDDNEYCFDLVLRNNRTDEAHPYGIFHPTEDMHNIKKEAIGIIEVMGLFILPGRLSNECQQIKSILTGKTDLNFQELASDDNPLQKHLSIIAQLVTDHGTKLRDEDAGNILTTYINETCEKILDCTAVFKNDELGQLAFDNFMQEVCKE